MLITCKGTVGEISFNTFGDAHIARQIMAIRNTFNIDCRYLAICLRYYMVQIKDSARGIIPGITREDILNLLLPVPPQNLQNKIVQHYTLFEYKLKSMEESLK